MTRIETETETETGIRIEIETGIETGTETAGTMVDDTVRAPLMTGPTALTTGGVTTTGNGRSEMFLTCLINAARTDAMSVRTSTTDEMTVGVLRVQVSSRRHVCRHRGT